MQIPIPCGQRPGEGIDRLLPLAEEAQDAAEVVEHVGLVAAMRQGRFGLLQCLLHRRNDSAEESAARG
jgi:hypothetical protein